MYLLHVYEPFFGFFLYYLLITIFVIFSYTERHLMLNIITYVLLKYGIVNIAIYKKKNYNNWCVIDVE